MQPCDDIILISDLISKVEERVRQCWLADDASAIESLMGIQAWWDRLVEIGYLVGYFFNELKTSVIVINEVLQEYNSLPAENAVLDSALDQYLMATNIAVKWSPGGMKKWRNCVELQSLIRDSRTISRQPTSSR